MPDWRPLNPDVRAQAIMLRHLLSMTSGFEWEDSGGTAAPMVPAAAWSRVLQAETGERFCYDNNMPGLVAAVLECATAKPVADLVRDQLFTPMQIQEPSLVRGMLAMRTLDMAKVGQLLLQDGLWGSRYYCQLGLRPR